MKIKMPNVQKSKDGGKQETNKGVKVFREDDSSENKRRSGKQKVAGEQNMFMIINSSPEDSN